MDKKPVLLIAKKNFSLYNIWEEEIQVSMGQTFKGTRTELQGLEVIAIEMPQGDSVYVGDYLREFFEVKECDADAN